MKTTTTEIAADSILSNARTYKLSTADLATWTGEYAAEMIEGIRRGLDKAGTAYRLHMVDGLP